MQEKTTPIIGILFWIRLLWLSTPVNIAQDIPAAKAPTSGQTRDPRQQPPRQHSVTEASPISAHPLARRKHDSSARGRGDSRRSKGVLHEGELERKQQRGRSWGHPVLAKISGQTSLAFVRPATCFGAKTRPQKIAVWQGDDHPPVARRE